MALLLPVAGPHTSTYLPGTGAVGYAGGARTQGITSDDGYRLRWTIHKQRIGNDGTDRWGQSLLENIYRGADWSIDYRCREYGLANMQATWPYAGTVAGAGVAALAPSIGIPGTADDTSAFAGVLAMTAVSGTPAATNPASLTSSHAVIADGQQYDLIFTSKLRETPVMLNLLPYSVSGGTSATPVWFITT
jgi:hypothetical protein